MGNDQFLNFTPCTCDKYGKSLLLNTILGYFRLPIFHSILLHLGYLIPNPFGVLVIFI